MKIEHTTVRQTLATSPSGAHVSITSWGNGEGWDIEVCDEHGHVRTMQMYTDEWDALVKTMREHMAKKPMTLPPLEPRSSTLDTIDAAA